MAVWDTINYNIHQDSPVNWRNSDAINRGATYPKPFTPPNMLDVSGEVGEYGQRPGEGYNEDMYQENTGGLIDYLKTQGSKFKDFAMPALKDGAGRIIASQVGSGVGNMMFGVPGALAGMIFGGLKGGNMFNQPYIGGHNTIDQYGNLISGEELDKQNAAGGYYTDAARASRRRDKSIRNMIARRDAGLNYGENRLEKLLKFQDKEQTSRIEAHTGEPMSDYRASRPSSERQFTGQAPQGTTQFDTKSGMGRRDFYEGGIVGMYR